MRAVVQRVSEATVTVDGCVVGAIDTGLCVLLSVGQHDDDNDVGVMSNKLAGLRVFADDQGRMNLNVAQVGGQMLVISQFTLHGDVRRGKRPSFVAAMEPERARAMVTQVCVEMRDLGLTIKEGQFGANMAVHLCNQGPVTILIDTKKRF
jgi:D-tyrosyl-tRNA(Tyr) deacylase